MSVVVVFSCSKLLNWIKLNHDDGFSGTTTQMQLYRTAYSLVSMFLGISGVVLLDCNFEIDFFRFGEIIQSV